LQTEVSGEQRMGQAQDEQSHRSECQTEQRSVVESETSAAVPNHSFCREKRKRWQTEQAKEADDQGDAVERQSGEQSTQGGEASIDLRRKLLDGTEGI